MVLPFLWGDDPLIRLETKPSIIQRPATIEYQIAMQRRMMKAQNQPYWKIERSVQSKMYQRHLWNRKLLKMEYNGYDVERIMTIQKYWRSKVNI
jgi:hypothetical protein